MKKHMTGGHDSFKRDWDDWEGDVGPEHGTIPGELKQLLLDRHAINYENRQAGRPIPEGLREAQAFARYLRSARRNTGHSLMSLSRQTGMDWMVLSSLENGHYLPPQIADDWIRFIAAALGEDAGTLLLLLGRLDVAQHAPPVHTENRESREPSVIPYWGFGHVNSVVKIRTDREPRDPDRLFMDK